MINIYTPPEAAVEILEERRQNPALRARVAEYLGDLLPCDCLELEKPVAILARYVPRATGEDRKFAEAAQEAGFEPYWASYEADRFTTRNPEKVETVRPPIRWQKGQKTRSWVVEPDKRYGGVGQMQTIYGCPSSEYQQNIREIVMLQDGIPELAVSKFDMADWYKSQAPRFGYEQGNLASYYYPAIMALATAFCALYEDFDGGPNASSGDLADFKSSVVYPAVAKVERDLGLGPVIVRLPFVAGMNETDLSFLDTEQADQFKKYGYLPPQSVTVEGSDE